MAKVTKFSYAELLCVVAIVSIVAMFALPEFLRSGRPRTVCANVASWAKNRVGATIKVQKAYRAEQGEFTSSIQQVERYLGVKDLQHQDDWRFSIQKQGNAVLMYATALPPSLIDRSLYSYVSAVAYDERTGEYRSIICRTTKPSSIVANAPILERKRHFPFGQQSLQWRCAQGTHDC